MPGMRFNQGITTTAYGVAMVGAVGALVTANVQAVAGAGWYRWELLNVPSGSALGPATPESPALLVQGAAATSATFTPDVPYSYRVRVQAFDANGGTLLFQDVRCFAAADADGNVLPSTSDTENETNWATGQPKSRLGMLVEAVGAALEGAVGNTRGWTSLVPGVDFDQDDYSTDGVLLLTDQSARIPNGAPLRITADGQTTYAVARSTVLGVLSIDGAPLSVGAQVTEVSFGLRANTVQLVFAVPGAYATNPSAAVLATIAKQYHVWDLPPARLCRLRLWQQAGTGTPNVNLTIDGAGVCSDNAGAGLTLAAPGVPYRTTVNLTAANLRAEQDDVIEVSVASGDGTDSDLSVLATFVLE